MFKAKQLNTLVEGNQEKSLKIRGFFKIVGIVVSLSALGPQELSFQRPKVSFP